MGQVLNFQAGQPFAQTLARSLLRETQGRPDLLSQYKIFLPTRRACRVLRDSFLMVHEGKPLLLPQMTPLGDVEEEDLSLQIFGQSKAFLDIPPAISPMKRRIWLARLIAANPAYGQGMDQALSLAQALGQFMDQVIIEGLDFADLGKIVPEEFADHWKITIDFLKIITENWPMILSENGVIDTADRRNRLLRALAEFWEEHPPQTPIIAAGSTGSIPATANLLRVISRLPQGRIILPGLDGAMELESWTSIAPSHPQYGLKQILERMNVSREEVQIFDEVHQETPRQLLAREMMRPAQTTFAWKDFAARADIPEMLEGLDYYPCTTQQEEAQVTALLMREILQKSSQTAALITPDRGLARRVSALCRRWGIEVDDSAGLSLRESGIGKFMMLCLRGALGEQFEAPSFLAMLKHDLCGAMTQADISALEIEFLRSDAVFTNLESLMTAIKGHKIEASFQSVIQALEPLKGLEYKVNFTALITAHIQVMEALAGEDRLWAGEDGEAAAIFLSDLQQNAALFPDVSIVEFADILEIMMADITIRSPYGVHPRLLILGQLEARLTSADLIILGGLNEKIWPPDIGHDPWLSRPMRAKFGLPDRDKALGLAAHDFVQGFCAPRVVITRAERIEGAPSVPARWLQRLETVLKGAGYSLQDLSRKPYQAWAKAMDDHDSPQSYIRPAPKPPLSARPDGISITRVENWVRDPYSVYAYDILRLRKLRPLMQQQDAALRGTVLHEILECFLKAYPQDLPPDARDRLVAMGRDVMAARLQDQGALRYWWPRFLKIADWFVGQETAWRQKAKFLETELEGNWDIMVDDAPFNIQGRVDRIDRMAGGYGIIDFKTSAAFSKAKLEAGALPQLPLAALMLRAGGFDGKGLRRKPADPQKKRAPAAPVLYLGYWKMTGGKESGAETAIEGDIEDTLEAVESGFKELVRVFRDPQTAYLSVPDPANAPRFNDYEHLARLKEWMALDDVAEENGSGEAA